MGRRSKDINKISIDTAGEEDRAGPEPRCREAIEYDSKPKTDDTDNENEDDDAEWEDGFIPTFCSISDSREDSVNGVSVEFEVSHGSANRKSARRATAKEKKVTELVHKVHLLCLLGRGRLIDSACNDPLIQASLLSIVPTHLLKIVESPNLTATRLSSFVNWFRNNFKVRSSTVAEKSCHFALASTLETREGTPEAVAALSVALFRALNLTTRFVSILDVIALKPDADKSESSSADVCGRDIFSSSTLMVPGPSCSSAYTVKSSPNFEQDSSGTAIRVTGRQNVDKSRKRKMKSHDFLNIYQQKDKTSEASVSEVSTDTSEPCLVKSEGSKRKGDIEFETQMKMALAATAVGNSDVSTAQNASESPGTSSPTHFFKRIKKIGREESHAHSTGISTAIGSKKVGPPLYWAEVFCSGENLSGKWVHVDVVNGILDLEDKVEGAAAACKKSLRYVVAFAGNGAKDVTRRYCTKWYKVATQRVNSTWWDSVLKPLKELESGATDGLADLEYERKKVESEKCCVKKAVESPVRNSFAPTRSSLEDMELETRALTEPLPTNQQAYRNHHLYVIEKWIKKYEILHPKGPVLGFCGGHAVYPRTCVQTLHTKERWLREGLQVKPGEVPAKVMKRSLKCNKQESKEDAAENNDYGEVGDQGITVLYGTWQTEPLCLPRAVNGIVPKNERGQVDVWSEKCLPPGTIHLPFPRVAAVAKRLDIDFAPAMVGFEFQNGRSFPLFEGIVVCAEFKDAILAAYFEEEERREADEKRKNEAQALSRWYQLLSSIVTRQRLNDCYGDGSSLQPSFEKASISGDKCHNSADSREKECQHANTSLEELDPPETMITENHEHEFVADGKTFGEEGSTCIKRCSCGFSIEFEEL